MEQLADPTFVLPDGYVETKGRICRASDYHPNRPEKQPKMIFVMNGVSGLMMDVVGFDVGPQSLSCIQSNTMAVVSDVQRKAAFSGQGYELLFNDSGRGGRRAATIRMLPDDAAFPQSRIDLTTFRDLAREPLGDVPQKCSLRLFVLEIGPSLCLTRHRRTLTVRDENQDRRECPFGKTTP